MGEIRNAYNILVGKPEGTRSLESSRRRWMNLGEVVWKSVDRMHLAQEKDQWRLLWIR